MSRPWCRTAWMALTLTIAGAAASAQESLPPRQLARSSLEDLLNITITSASGKEERGGDAPAAVYVLTHDDIVRSGVRSLPELFRFVPGVQVAQMTATNWAVSIRGFNNLYANKLQVLVDGRSVYKRSSSGVFWDIQDLVLDDIDRVEIIRGPGSVVWGSNAVNGVINIVTRSAADTPGALVRVGGGTFDGTQALARYGGSIPNGAFRVYSQWTKQFSPDLADGTPANNTKRSIANGIRVDWSRSADSLTVDGNFVAGDGRGLWMIASTVPDQPPQIGEPLSTHGGNAMARWTHRMAGGSSLQVQAFADVGHRDDLVVENETTYNVDVQYRVKARRRHDVIFGGGYRDADNSTDGNFSYSLSPGTPLEGQIISLFAQDEISIPGGLRTTLGTRLEHDNVVGWGLQPTARIIWDAPRGQHLWAAISRSQRTPSSGDLGRRVNYAFFTAGGSPIILGLQGNPDYQSERLMEVEAGYRVQFGTTVALDVTAFQGNYAKLPTMEPLPPTFEATPAPAHLYIGTQLNNLLSADTSGVEIAGHVTPISFWRVDASYSGFRLTPHVDASSRDSAAAQFDGNAPAHQWQVHSSLWLGKRTQVDASWFHVGNLVAEGVPAYSRADMRVEVALTSQLSVIAAGRNLSERSHIEFNGVGSDVVATRVPRSGDLQLVWRFR